MIFDDHGAYLRACIRSDGIYGSHSQHGYTSMPSHKACNLACVTGSLVCAISMANRASVPTAATSIPVPLFGAYCRLKRRIVSSPPPRNFEL